MNRLGAFAFSLALISAAHASVIFDNTQDPDLGNQSIFSLNSLYVDVYSSSAGAVPEAFFQNMGTRSMVVYDFPTAIALSANTRYCFGISSSSGSDADWELACESSCPAQSALDVGAGGEFYDDGSITTISFAFFRCSFLRFRR
jgi:hypothetical protein